MYNVLIPFKDVASIDFVEDIIQAAIVSISNNCFTLLLEFCQVVDDLRAKEGLAIGNRRLVDDDLGTLGLDALHDALDSRLTEIVGVALHGEAIDTNDALLFAMGIPLAAGFVIACFTKNFVGNEVLTGAVALDNGGHHGLRYIGIVGQKLFGVLREAVAAIAKARVVIVSTNAGVEANTRDNSLGIEALDLGIGIEFVEVADAKGKVGIGEELDGFGFGHAHEETRDGLVELRIDN